MIVRELITSLGFKVDQSAISRAENGFRSLRNMAFGVTAAVTAIGGAVAYFAKKAGEMEQVKVAFETMTGSAEVAGKLIKDLTAFAARTPFELTGIFTTTKLLMGMGIEVDKMIPTLKALGDVSAGLSVPIERIALNFGQIKAQGKLTGRELRDFAVAGVPLLDELSKMLGKSKEAVGDLVSAGKVDFATVEKAFIRMSSEGGRFANMMIKQSKTLLGLYSNLKDFLEVTAIQIGEEFLPQLKDFAQGILDWIDANRELIKVKIQEWAVRARESFISLYHATKKVVDAVGGFGNVLKIVAGLLGLIVVGKLATALYSIGSVIAAIVGAVGAVPLAVITAVSAAVVWIYALYDDVRAFFEGEKSVTEMIFRAGVRAGIRLREVFEEVKAVIRAAFEDPLGFIKTGFLQLGQWIGVFFRTTFEGVSAFVRAVFNTPLDVIKERFLNVFSEIAAFIKRVFSDISVPGWETVKGWYQKIRENPVVQRVVTEEVEAARARREAPTVSPQIGEQVLLSAGIGNRAYQVPLPAAPSVTNNNVKLETKVEVNVESGADPDQIARSVQEKVNGELDSMMRRTLRASEAGGY